MIVLLHHSGRGNHVVIADGVNYLGQGQAIAGELFGVHNNMIFLGASSHDAGFGDSRQAVKTRSKIVIGQVPKLGCCASGRSDTESDHGKHGKGQTINVKPRRGWQGGRDLRNPALHEM